jgi:hypothetical protein
MQNVVSVQFLFLIRKINLLPNPFAKNEMKEILVNMSISVAVLLAVLDGTCY